METQVRARRFRRGLGGLWDRVTGKHSQIRQENEREAYASIARDDLEREDLVARQQDEKRSLQTEVKAIRARQHEELSNLRADVLHYAGLAGSERSTEQSPTTLPRTPRPIGPDVKQPNVARDTGEHDPSP